MNPFLIYLWQMADILSGCLLLAFALTGIFSLILFIYSATMRALPDINRWYYVRTVRNRMCALFAASVLGLVFMPSSRTVAMMYVIPELAHDSQVQKLHPEISEMAMAALKAEMLTLIGAYAPALLPVKSHQPLPPK